MAYMNQERKTKIVAEVKKVLPKGWKVTFGVRNYSTIVCTVRSAPVDIKAAFDLVEGRDRCDHYDVNHFHYEKHCKDPDLVKTLGKIIDALNLDNYDNSDVMTDYFDVGHYIDFRFGEWDKPFKNSAL